MNRPRLEAIGMLKRARCGEVLLSEDQWHDLTLLETGSKELAEHAYKDAVRAGLRAKGRG